MHHTAKNTSTYRLCTKFNVRLFIGFRDYPVRSDGKNNTVSQDSYKRVLPKFVIPNPKTINERYLRNGELEFAKDVFARETVPCVCGLVLAEAIVCAPYFAAGLYR